MRSFLRTLFQPSLPQPVPQAEPAPPTAPLAAHFGESTRLHLGCGGNQIPGWSNVDLVAAPGVVVHDLTTPLPLPEESIEYIFSEHLLEHLTREQGLAFLRDCHRVLKVGGVVRISTPDLGKLVAEYEAGRISEWHDVGFFPPTPCVMVNQGMRLWNHQFLYDPSELLALLHEAGFAEVVTCAWHRSPHEVLQNLECRPYHGEIIVEATRTTAVTT
jgi:predicted SAM-dependent methyltransferase